MTSLHVISMQMSQCRNARRSSHIIDEFGVLERGATLPTYWRRNKRPSDRTMDFQCWTAAVSAEAFFHLTELSRQIILPMGGFVKECIGEGC